MALLGPEGLRRVAARCMRNARSLRERMAALPGVRVLFGRPGFHEFAVALPLPAETVIERLAGARILAGVALGEDYPELGDALLVCATETKTDADLDRYVEALDRALR
jgi:glycine dehydrogenase subunit 1